MELTDVVGTQLGFCTTKRNRNVFNALYKNHLLKISKFIEPNSLKYLVHDFISTFAFLLSKIFEYSRGKKIYHDLSNALQMST